MNGSKLPKAGGYRGYRRDKIVAGFATWVIETFASQMYLSFMTLLMQYGRAELNRRLREGESLGD